MGDTDDERTAISIRVRRDDDIDIDAHALGDSQVQGTGLLRVGEGHRGEVGVGIALGHHGEGRREARSHGRLLEDCGSHAVHGGVKAHDIARRVTLRHERGLRHVVLHDVVAEGDVVVGAG